jgi:hypothetical protein
MTPRLQSGLVVNALIRRVNTAGGFATVLARGDESAGAILIVILEGAEAQAWERGWDADGRPALVATGPADGSEADVSDYWQRRRAQDRDLWVVELVVPDAKRFAAETILTD